MLPQSRSSTRYVVLKALPHRLRYRGGVTVVLECTRDVAATPPVYVFRARRLPSPSAAAPLAADSPAARPGRESMAASQGPVPTVSPIALAAARETLSHASLVLARAFTRRQLDDHLRDGLVLQDGSPEARLMDTLERLGYVRSTLAIRNDQRG